MLRFRFSGAAAGASDTTASLRVKARTSAEQAAGALVITKGVGEWRVRLQRAMRMVRIRNDGYVLRWRFAHVRGIATAATSNARHDDAMYDETDELNMHGCSYEMAMAFI